MLRPDFQVTIAPSWSGAPFGVMLALHVRRSAGCIARWANAQGESSAAPGLAVVLTGTDLYRDIQTDAAAQASLAYAEQLVVLQECALEARPTAVRSKTCVIFQSATPWQTAVKPKGHLRAVMVGHLRDEIRRKPFLPPHACSKTKPTSSSITLAIRWMLIWAGRHWPAPPKALTTAGWAGCHMKPRAAASSARMLVHTSRMEGGAHVLMEAICSDTPVLASKIAGNVGMLGAEYAGYFEHGDAQRLADLLHRFRAAQANYDGFYSLLQAQCAQRSPCLHRVPKRPRSRSWSTHC